MVSRFPKSKGGTESQNPYGVDNLFPDEDGGAMSPVKWPSQRETQPYGMEGFLLEDEVVDAQGHGVALLNTRVVGTLSVTNFRLLFVSETGDGVIELGTIPLTTIEKFTDDVKLPSMSRHDKKAARELLQVVGKDMRIIIFSFPPRTKQKNEVLDALRRYTKPNMWDLFAFVSIPPKLKNNVSPKIRLLEEYYRLLFGKNFPRVPNGEIQVESLSLSNSRWRLTAVNTDYALCSSYPYALIVPKSISDEELLQASTFRAAKRLPVISWCDPGTGVVLARSSQPYVFGFISRNDTDEKLVGALCSDRHGSESLHWTWASPPIASSKLYIVDARPRANALANGAKGGGSESSSNYSKSEVVFLGIQNIHTMRESLARLREYLDVYGTASSDGPSPYLKNRGSTSSGGNLQSMSSFSSMLGDGGWLNHIQNILVAASWITGCIAVESASVFVHCSDGWDRTTQLVSLASLLLDPYYRTFSGFQALVEKDWLAFGHPFAERMGIPTIPDCSGSQTDLLRQPSLGSLSNSPSRSSSVFSSGLTTSSNSSSHSQTSNNCSPILLQWLDCISQLLRLYPYAFQFSSKFLVDFMDCVLSCRFGNFLCNSEKERESCGVADTSPCIWLYLADLRASGGSVHEHFNPFYDAEKHKGPLLPPAAALAPTIWPQFHLRWTCPSESNSSELDSQWRSMSHKYGKVKKAKENAESKARDLEMQLRSLSNDLQREKQSSRSAQAMARNARRESFAMKRAIQSLGCSVNFSGNENEPIDTESSIVSRSEGMSYSLRRDSIPRSLQDERGDISITISAIEDTPSSNASIDRMCESFCPLRTREGCRWPDSGCVQVGSQFVGLKADFDAFDRLSIDDSYF